MSEPSLELLSALGKALGGLRSSRIRRQAEALQLARTALELSERYAPDDADARAKRAQRIAGDAAPLMH